VQVTAQSTALLLAGYDDPLPGGLQVAGQSLATALLAFSVFKIVWIHESASYLIASLDLVLLACLTAASTRRFTTR
jgi:putative effector of murein hydrolase LrgA (UPF0299 family)